MKASQPQGIPAFFLPKTASVKTAKTRSSSGRSKSTAQEDGQLRTADARAAAAASTFSRERWRQRRQRRERERDDWLSRTGAGPLLLDDHGRHDELPLPRSCAARPHARSEPAKSREARASWERSLHEPASYADCLQCCLRLVIQRCRRTIG